MAQEITNYARFYALLGKLPGANKETLVYQFTNGRTTHLRLMADSEYRSMCNEMERVAIAGRMFRDLAEEELDALLIKLRTIRRKGGLSPKE